MLFILTQASNEHQQTNVAKHKKSGVAKLWDWKRIYNLHHIKHHLLYISLACLSPLIFFLSNTLKLYG